MVTKKERRRIKNVMKRCIKMDEYREKLDFPDHLDFPKEVQEYVLFAQVICDMMWESSDLKHGIVSFTEIRNEIFSEMDEEAFIGMDEE
tara:strand:- start:2897 stop:3163 length:267 start_codon:yes stop_codon:yes gene_type:complete